MSRATFTVPGYLVDAPLGSGASSQVWLGRASGSHDPVALKRIQLRDAAQAGAARAEAALLAELDHPNLVRLHDIVIDGSNAVLVLDLAAGGSLADLLTTRVALSPGEVITALAPIASALAYLHDQGVVHGDVTPANILFTDAGQPMLADLGVARLVGDQSTVRSTPAYIDPGVAAGFMPAPQSDVFMLGGVALHALTGRPLWSGATAEDALFAALAANLNDLDERLDAARVPGEMRAVLRRALAIEPARRGTAADFALDLRYSDQPVAVELDAGRVREQPAPATAPPLRDVPPHRDIHDTDQIAPVVTPALPVIDAAVPVVDTDAQFDADEYDAGDEYDVDDDYDAADEYDEPVPATNPAQTHIAAPLARPRTHRHHRNRRHGSWVRWAVAGACVAALVGGGVAWGIAGTGTKTRADAPKSAFNPSLPPASAADGGAVETLSLPSSGSVTTAAGADSGASTASAKPVTAADMSTVLQQLDALRERAFARRAPLLLTGVYAPGPLLDEDTATLERIVPSGCGLEGVATTYSNVVVRAQNATSVSIDARAKLAQSVLFCNGVAKAKAAGSGPTTLHMTFSRSGSTFLITAVTP